MKTKINSRIAWLFTFPHRYYVLGGIVLMAFISTAFFWPRYVTFSYAEKTCYYQPTLVPDALISHSDFYRLEASNVVRINDIAVAALGMCVVPLKTPPAQDQPVQLSLKVMPFIAKTYVIHAPERPRVSLANITAPISVTQPLQLPLGVSDSIFTYKLAVDPAKTAPCRVHTATLHCDIKKLQLDQGKEYTVQIERYFGSKKVETVVRSKVETLSATKITDTSIKNGQTVYDKPPYIELVADKIISGARATMTGPENTTVQLRVETDGKKVRLAWNVPLERQSTYEVVLDEVTADDKSGLESPFRLSFRTSGGPKVTSVSVGRYKVPLGITAVLTFDQKLLSTQDVSEVVTTSGTAYVSGKKNNQLFISFADTPRCSDVSIKINDELQSEYGIAGGTSRSFLTRTIYQTVSQVGTSVQGRGIYAYSFGNGSDRLVLTGAIHGDEMSTRALMFRTIDDMEANIRSLPTGKSVTIIPVVNPDGYANGTRTNARNVDLNRNFATHDWKKDITTVSNKPFPGGGGSSPLSEPESRALANFIGYTKPSLVISYHSIGGVVLANGAGNSSSLGKDYASRSGYAYSTSSGSTFDYSVSGTADDYYVEQLGVPSLLVELGSHTYHQFERNKPAVWALLR